MRDIIKAIIYGLIEGLTEWLPVSSTGHLILLENLIPFAHVSEGFFDVFDVVIQLGAVLAVVVLFWDRLWPFTFSKKAREMAGTDTFYKKDTFILWLKIVVACVPAAIVGVFFDDFFNKYFYNYISVAVALIVFGIIFIVIENTIGKKNKFRVSSITDITFPMALQIGIFQILAAAFPGTSRSGATIIGAMLIGVSRTASTEFTFFLAIPVMVGASLLKIVKSGLVFNAFDWCMLGTGFIVSFIVSAVVCKGLIGYLRKHTFKPFGWYRIALGIVVILFACFAGSYFTE